MRSGNLVGASLSGFPMATILTVKVIIAASRAAITIAML